MHCGEGGMRTDAGGGAVARVTGARTAPGRWTRPLALAALLGAVGAAGAQPSDQETVRVAGEAYTVAIAHHRGYAAVPWTRLPADLAVEPFQRGGHATARVAGQPLELRVGSPFGRHGGSVFQLVNPPYLEGGQIWVPLELLTDWLPGATERAAHGAVRSGLPPAAGPAGTGVVEAAASSPTATPGYRRPGPWRVVIDPGHGGHDPGTRSPRTRVNEKDLTLSVARKLAGELRARGGYEPLLTRDRDVFVEVMKRPSLAVEWDADLFISIHVDAQPNGTGARGFTTFYLGRARTDYALEVARRENAVIELEEGSEPPNLDQLEIILGTMTRDAYRRESQLLAGRIQNALRTTGSRDRGVKPGPYYVLMTPGLLPAVLVELGFITNPADETRLKDEGVQDRIARSLADAIQGYLEDTGRRIETMEGRG